MEDVREGLIPMMEQSKVLRFLTSAENAQRIDVLTEDTREALMEYQVRMSDYPFSLTLPDVRARLHCNKTSTATAIGSS